MRRHRPQRLDHAFDFPTHHRDQRRPAALVGYMRQLDVGQRLKQFDRKMARGADAGRSVIHVAGPGARQRDEFRKRLGLYLGTDNQDARRDAERADRREILDHVERHVLVERFGIDQADVKQQHRVAVRRRLRDHVGPENPAGAALVLDEKLLAEFLAQLGSDNSCHHIRGAARRNGTTTRTGRSG